MGVGFVLLIFAVPLFLAAIVSSFALAVLNWRQQRQRLGRVQWFRVLGACSMPYGLLAYSFVAVLVYAAWCDRVRGVDLGIGDVSSVPVANGYVLCAFDTTDSWSLLNGRCEGETAVAGISRLALVGDLVVGEAPAFEFDTRTRHYERFSERGLIAKRLGRSVELEDATSFYLRHRWGWPDLIAAMLWLCAGSLIGFFWYRQVFLRARAQLPHEARTPW